MESSRNFQIAIREYLKGIEEQAVSSTPRIVELPLRNLQKTLKGLKYGEVTILGGYEGHGKSALAQQIAFHAASEFAQDKGKKRGVLYYSIEMGYQQLVGRAIVQHTGLDSDLLNHPHDLSSQDWEYMREFQDNMENIPLVIEDGGIIETEDIREDLKLYGAEYDVKLVVVDYFQLLSDPIEKGSDEVARLDRMIKTLKDVARRFDLHVIALSSLNRALEPKEKTPSNKNLRGSGGIAFSVDNVCLLHRPKLFNPIVSKDWENYALFMVTKARSGPCGIHYLRWDDVYLKFHDCSKEEINTLKKAQTTGVS